MACSDHHRQHGRGKCQGGGGGGLQGFLCKTFGEDELSTEERVPVSTARAAEHCMELGSNVKEISVKKL